MTFALIIAAFSMGFFGSPHCLGMCGGIVTAFGLSMQSLSSQKRFLLILTYHIGRLGSYLILGLIAATFGKHLIAPFLMDNDLPRYLLGAALVFAGLMMFGLPVLNKLEKLGLGLWNRMAPIRSKVLPINTLPKALFAGLLWGFLPCGMVYGALAMAITLATHHQVGLTASVFMLFFWLGTLPMLLTTNTLLAVLQHKIKSFRLRHISAALMVVSGFAVALSSPLMHSLHGSHHHHMHHGAHDMEHSEHSHHHMHGEDEHSHHSHDMHEHHHH